MLGIAGGSSDRAVRAPNVPINSQPSKYFFSTPLPFSFSLVVLYYNALFHFDQLFRLDTLLTNFKCANSFYSSQTCCWPYLETSAFAF